MIQNKYSCTHTTRACQLFRLSLSPSPHPPNSFPSMLFSRDGKKKKGREGRQRKRNQNPRTLCLRASATYLPRLKRKKRKAVSMAQPKGHGRAGPAHVTSAEHHEHGGFV